MDTRASVAEPASAAAGPLRAPSERLFVTELLLLMVVGRLLGEAMLRIKQRSVVSQLIVWLLVGPSVLGAFALGLEQALFSPSVEQKLMIDAVAQFGILILLVLTGMETDLKLVRRSGRVVISASLAGVALPFLPPCSPCGGSSLMRRALDA